MDRSRARPVPCPSAVRPARAPLPRASARLVSADARLDRAGGSASKADNHSPVRRLMLQKNRRFRVPVFLPSMWAGRKFQSCARRCKKYLRSSYRVSLVRDTSSRPAAEVRAFSCGKARRSESLMHRRNSSNEFYRNTPFASCALNSERKAAVGNAADIHKRGVRILEQPFDHDFGFAVIHNLRVDDVVTCVVSAKHATIAKVDRVFVNGAVPLALIGVNKDRACLKIRVTRRNRGVRKQNDALAKLRPAQAVPARTASGRIYFDERVIRCPRFYHATRCLCNFGR